ncbi:AAA family ATPase [Jiangella anatolica]|uniref:Transcriptional regulator n=1 Tax=Jiangella anatolica TaxID=2670374 RepID=A0A2W2B8D9_9ACTN|nr:AAA family ATPase [Jiangella anatolica]PZF83761.1 transcriptional regulator [Jiangella anatolica]
MYRHALVIGKFYPPHAGHHHLVRTAATVAERVTVVAMAAATESLPLADRVRWLREVHAVDPGVVVTGVRCDAPMDLESETVWAAQVASMRAATAAVTATPIDVVLTGEAYGAELARRFGAAHVAVDPDRTQVPVSATAVRADLAGHWHRLAAPVRRDLACRVVVVGAESTGTTTVSQVLAEHYRARGGVWRATAWVPEYGRHYTVAKLAQSRVGRPEAEVTDLVWTAPDFAVIAGRQNRMEDLAAATGSPLVVCDTDAFATTIWERRYLGRDSHHARVAGTVDLPRRDVYLVTDHIGVPFVQDGLRDGEQVRARMTGWFTAALTAAGHSWVLLTGTLDQRLRLAVRVVDQLLAVRCSFAEPMKAEAVGG